MLRKEFMITENFKSWANKNPTKFEEIKHMFFAAGNEEEVLEAMSALFSEGEDYWDEVFHSDDWK